MRERSRLVHEVVEVTKLFGSLYLSGCSFENGVMNFLRERCDECNLQHHGAEPFWQFVSEIIY